MSRDNLEIWSQVEKTDPQFTKNFNRSGGFAGTAINQTYQTKRATEIFGPLGIGWGFNELEHIIVDGAPGDKVWFCKVRLWYLHHGERGEVEQWGATTFVGKNKYGAFTDEEAAKKSITDAVGKCLSLLGFSADVFTGCFDDHKYVNDRRREAAEERKAEAGKKRAAFRLASAAAQPPVGNSAPTGHLGNGTKNGHQETPANGHDNGRGNGRGNGQPKAASDVDNEQAAGEVYKKAEAEIDKADSIKRLNELRRKIREPHRELSKEQIAALDLRITQRMKSVQAAQPAAN